MEAVCTSEMLVSTYESALRQKPEDHNRHLHRLENLRSHGIFYSFTKWDLHGKYETLFITSQLRNITEFQGIKTHANRAACSILHHPDRLSASIQCVYEVVNWVAGSCRHEHSITVPRRQDPQGFSKSPVGNIGVETCLILKHVKNQLNSCCGILTSPESVC
jgi:hypothetical protein